MAPSPVTEVAWLSLKDGIENIDESQSWKEFLSTVSAQKGFKQAYYGLTVEDPTLLELVIGKVF
jgi:hypothetical protein